MLVAKSKDFRMEYEYSVSFIEYIDTHNLCGQLFYMPKFFFTFADVNLLMLVL